MSHSPQCLVCNTLIVYHEYLKWDVDLEYFKCSHGLPLDFTEAHCQLNSHMIKPLVNSHGLLSSISVAIPFSLVLRRTEGVVVRGPLLPVYRSQILVQFPFSHDERGPFTYTPKLIPTQIPNCFFKNIEWLKFWIPVWTPLFDPWECSPQILTELL